MIDENRPLALRRSCDQYSGGTRVILRETTESGITVSPVCHPDTELFVSQDDVIRLRNRARLVTVR